MTLGPLIGDIETNGFLDEMTKLHSLVLRSADTGEIAVSGSAGSPGTISAALDALHEAPVIIGHNFLKFDAPAIEKLYPSARIPREKIIDTLLIGKVLWPDLKTGDFLRFKKGKMPGQHIGNYSLEAWGYRLGDFKGEYTDWCKANGIEDPWAEWRPEMQEYCEQDTQVNLALWRRILAKNLDPRCMTLEHEVANLCIRITTNGWPLDVPRATELYSEILAARDGITGELQGLFPPIERRSVFIPKVNNKKLGYQKGVPLERVKLEVFNPGSREEIAERLTGKYGWEPKEFTETGKPQIDETIVAALPYPEAPLLGRYLFLDKTASFFAGKRADTGWLRLEREGRIHAEYDTAGTITGRNAHKRPNIGQVPSVALGPDKHPLMGEPGGYGYELRSLYGIPETWAALVGADMSGLELRCLAHFMAPFDGGEYVKLVTEGDVHTANMHAAGLPTRAAAKTFIYAFLYGAGGWKLGHIADPGAPDDEKTKLGEGLKSNFLKRTPGLNAFRMAVSAAVRERGHLIGLDGRPLTIRSAHSAVNTLLQSAGAVLCKRWIVATEQELLGRGLRHDRNGDFLFHGWIHDEIQVSARTQETAQTTADVAVAQCALAGEFFSFRCPLTGEAKIGRNWATTH